MLPGVAEEPGCRFFYSLLTVVGKTFMNESEQNCMLTLATDSHQKRKPLFWANAKDHLRAGVPSSHITKDNGLL